ncbi:glycosyltransferase [Anthocerotibacter panamensis]|uniref:glycosyltransferase n=1 Tax=Anthocerotibacter panamensis TaxID=2857077 RepID=UPI001C405A67|nr:glycosyltransferase [Anthocerotibacter panamensis]
MDGFGLALSTISLGIWLGLLVGRGQFWRADTALLQPTLKPSPAVWPTVWAVVPARDEADVLPDTLPSLLQQTYPGPFHILLVDDRSTDGTGTVARAIAEACHQSERLTLLEAQPLPPGWTGKLWAMEQGVRYVQGQATAGDFWLFTDADICHDPENVTQLVSKAQSEQLDMVSLMVSLRCESFWEYLLIPAFVFFFQKLYPFRWVNDPTHKMAAAAGGCILVGQQALAQAGGLTAIRQALIDDCALAERVKRSGHRIWLGLSQTTLSLRPYPVLRDIWNMVARTAFTQLNYSGWLLLGTVLAMGIIYLVPPVMTLVGVLAGDWAVVLVSLGGWLLMALAFLPTLRVYRAPLLLSLILPVIGLLYTGMTVDSALRHWRGKGGAWKGRTYSPTN